MGPSPESVKTASCFAGSAAEISTDDDATSLCSLFANSDGNASEAFASPAFVSGDFASNSIVTGTFASCVAKFGAEFLASGSSQAGIFTSSAPKSNVDVPGAGFSLTEPGSSKLVSESRFSDSFTDSVKAFDDN